jgi:hypothetical protein
MKALFAIFAIAAGLALAGTAPAAAKPVSKSDLRCLVLDGGNYSRRVVNVCTCTTVANVPQDIRALLKPDASRVSLHCPAGGGTAPTTTVDRTPPPDDHGHGWSFSRGSSSSTFVGVAAGSGCSSGGIGISSLSNGGGCGSFAGIFATQRNNSVAIGDGGAADAGASSGGGAVNGTFGGVGVSVTGGSTSGSSCAGSGCGGGGGPL